jgi:peptidoglycan/LPS O-acetylase OafA/YrhL
MTEVTAVAETRDLRSLTGLRAPAALLVFLTHTTDFAAPHIPGWRVTYLGYVGVTLFFVLSGVVLGWSSSSSTSARRFWWRRFCRVYPLHLVLSIVALLVLRGQELAPTISAFLLLQTWWPYWHHAANPVSWSLCCEAFFYAVFPFLLLLLRGRSPRYQWAFAAVVTVLGQAVFVAGALLYDGRLDDPLHWHPVTNLPSFVLGVVIGLRLKQGWRPVISLRVAWAVAATAGAVVIALRIAAAGDRGTGIVVAILTPVFALLLAAHAGADLRGQSTGWAGAKVVYAGEVSFAFYLVQYIVIHGVTDRVGLKPEGLLTALAMISGLLVASWYAAVLLHERVEKPARQVLLGKARRPHG